MRSAVLLFCVLFVAACGQRVSVEERLDPYGGDDGEGETSRSATLAGEDTMQRAERLTREGDFGGAIDVYRNLYRHAPGAEAKAEALYEWARAEGHLLNPDRDVDAAVARLELLLEEFPDASIAFRAREELRRLQTWQDRSGRPRG